SNHTPRGMIAHDRIRLIAPSTFGAHSSKASGLRLFYFQNIQNFSANGPESLGLVKAHQFLDRARGTDDKLPPDPVSRPQKIYAGEGVATLYGRMGFRLLRRLPRHRRQEHQPINNHSNRRR